MEIIRKIYSNIFFNFVNNEKRKISYSASFGVDYWEDKTEITTEVKN